MEHITVRRTELTCPGSSMKMMAKAAASEADEVILDLEDAVAVSEKIASRRRVVEALNTLDWGDKIRAFRPNNLRTPYAYGDIIEVVEGAGEFLDVVVIPKVYGPEEVHFMDLLLGQIEQRIGLKRRIKIEVLIETAEAVIKAYEIARASDRVTSLIFGIADYAASTGARDMTTYQFDIFHYPKAQTIAAAKAAHIDAIDNVTLNIRDMEALERDAKMSAMMGFDGKWAIHPGQIGPINQIFTPTQEQIQKALHVIEEYRQAGEERGLGAIVVDDEMVDAATIRVEMKKLAVAVKAGLLRPRDVPEVVDPHPKERRRMMVA